MQNKVLNKPKDPKVKEYLWDLLNSTESILEEKAKSIIIFVSDENHIQSLLLGMDEENTIDTLLNLKINVIDNMLLKLGIDTTKTLENIKLSKEETEVV